MNKAIYLLSRFFQSPVEALFSLLIFIMVKDLKASPLQLTLLVASKPAVSFITYLSSLLFVSNGSYKKPFLLISSALSSISCLMFPFIDNLWFYIFSYALFMVSLRSALPIWIECLKNEKKFTSLLATGNSINYSVIVLMTLFAAFFLDEDTHVWKSLFFVGGLFQLLHIAALSFLKLESTPQVVVKKTLNIKNSFKLLVNNRPFLNFQILFFLGGIGLVSLQPIIPIYFSEQLNFSYKEFALALSLCRGFAFAASSHFWANLLNKSTILYLCFILDLVAVFFVGFLLMGLVNPYWIYLGYLIYGALQSGCELTWNYSGAYYAKQNESLSLSGINHFFMGLRGIGAPFLGQLLFFLFGFSGIFLFSGLLSILSAHLAYKLNKETVSHSVSPCA